MTAPNELTVAQAVSLLEKRELSAEELLDSCLERIAQREPQVQAWEALDPRGALEQARRIDASPRRPLLHGVPVGIKDLIDTADLPTTYGSPIYRGHRPPADAACVSALRAAGAVFPGKTVTTEFAVFAPGKTRNPHDPARTPGGSSSGSAAAVADRMVPAALGSQTAGSVIRPASFCGVVGFKPSFGALDLRGVHPLAPSLDTLGFFVRTVEDIPWMTAALQGGLPPAALELPRRLPRLGLCRTDQWPRAGPGTQRLVEQAAARLERAGCSVREVELGVDGLADAQADIMSAEAAGALRVERQSNDAQLSDRLRSFLREGETCPPERLRAARELAQRGRRAFEALFDQVDALLTPAAAGEAPALDTTGDPAFCRIWTLLGAPCASLPLLEGPAGLPIGLQLVGARGRDAQLVAAAAWIEQAY